MALSDITNINSTLTNPFGTPSQGEWNLARGVFTNEDGASVVFFYEKSDPGENKTSLTAMDQVTDSGGRRLAVYEYPYRDGQRIKDLGRKGETYTFNIQFHGLNYQTRFNEFLSVVNTTNKMGTIVHPIRGAIKVRFRDYEFIHSHDQWNSVRIKAVFLEDNTDTFALIESIPVSQDSAIRVGLQNLVNKYAAISQLISDVSASLLLPAAIENGIKARLDSLTGQVSRLFGQLAATYSSDAQIQQLAAQAILTDAGSITSLNSGKVSTGSSQDAELPPVFQVGFDSTTQTSINAQTSSFVNANQITTQQAVFQANQSRQAIRAAIQEVTDNMGNQGYDIVLQYRSLAISIQESVEAAISASKNKVKLYVVNSPMSLRMVAKNSGLEYNRQNDIEALNPYLPSVNYLPAGTVITVPAS